MCFIFLFGYTIGKKRILRREGMLRLNKKIIMGIVLLLVLSILGGCKSKPPEGVGQEFYDDMISASEELIKTIRIAKIITLSDNDILKTKNYTRICEYNKYEYDSLTLVEQNILNAINDLYFTSVLYYDDIYNDIGRKDVYKKDIKKLAKTFSNLMGIELDANKILLE